MPKAPHPCPRAGCGYPEGECSGECLTPRIGFGRPRLVVDCSHLTFLPTISELTAQLHAVPGRLEPGPVVAMPVDFTHPDPVAGDPWPRHLCMPSLEWLRLHDPVLRPDASRALPTPRAIGHGGDCHAPAPSPAFLVGVLLGLAAVAAFANWAASLITATP